MPELPHRTLGGAVHRGGHQGGVRRDHRGRHRLSGRKGGRFDPGARGRDARGSQGYGLRAGGEAADELSALQHVRDRQQATIASEDSFDAVGAHAEGESACVQIFAVRDGQIVNRDSFLLDNYGEALAESVALSFIPQYYDTAAVPEKCWYSLRVRRRTWERSPNTSPGCEERGWRFAALNEATSGASWRWPSATRRSGLSMSG